MTWANAALRPYKNGQRIYYTRQQWCRSNIGVSALTSQDHELFEVVKLCRRFVVDPNSKVCWSLIKSVAPSIGGLLNSCWKLEFVLAFDRGRDESTTNRRLRVSGPDSRVRVSGCSRTGKVYGTVTLEHYPLLCRIYFYLCCITFPLVYGLRDAATFQLSA